MTIPRRIELQHGRVEFSREAVVEIDGVATNAFAENTLVARVEHDNMPTIIVAFPRGYLTSGPSRDSALASACAAAGWAQAKRRTEVRLVDNP